MVVISQHCYKNLKMVLYLFFRTMTEILFLYCVHIVSVFLWNITNVITSTVKEHALKEWSHATICYFRKLKRYEVFYVFLQKKCRKISRKWLYLNAMNNVLTFRMWSTSAAIGVAEGKISLGPAVGPWFCNE